MRWLVITLVVSAGMVQPAMAQTPRWQIGIGAVLAGTEPAGDTSATLLNPSGGGLTLFRTSNRVTAGAGVEGLLSLRLRDRLRAELSVGWVTADFETRISSDFEDVPDISVTQGVQQFRGELAVAYRLLQRGRWSAFLRGGAGGFREITSDKALVDNGVSASVGGVSQYLVRRAASGLFGRVALRVEARLQVRRGGIEFGDASARLSPVFVAGLIFGR